MNAVRFQYDRTRDETGAGILEVLVALFLFSIAMLGLAQLGYASILGNKTSQSMMEATVLCQEQMELAKSIGYEAVTDSLHEQTEDYGSIYGYEHYKRHTTVTDIPAAGVKQVRVKVFWGDDAHSFELQTAISQR